MSAVKTGTYYSSHGVIFPDYAFLQNRNGKAFCKSCHDFINIQVGKELSSLLSHTQTNAHKNQRPFSRNNMFTIGSRRASKKNHRPSAVVHGPTDELFFPGLGLALPKMDFLSVSESGKPKCGLCRQHILINATTTALEDVRKHYELNEHIANALIKQKLSPEHIGNTIYSFFYIND